MSRGWKLTALAVWAFGSFAQSSGFAAVVVLDNHTEDSIDFTLRLPEGRESRGRITSNDVMAVPVSGPVEITFGSAATQRRHALEPNSIHYFLQRKRQLELFQLALPQVDGERPDTAGRASSQVSADGVRPAVEAVYTVPVMILADEEEARLDSVWGKQIRARMAEASAIFERVCRVRFEVVEVGKWNSDRSIRNFEKSLNEFERNVQPGPGRLAIGFTSHYTWTKGEVHAGGTHGPLCSHILVREALGRVSEPERLEVLVHELGHYLGAVHASDSISVMRPKLGDGRARLKSFHVGFDAPNTLILCLVADQLRGRRITGLGDLSPESKRSLRSLYTLLAKSMPGDPSAPLCLALLGPPAGGGAVSSMLDVGK